jgi:hypothetical protein
MEEKEIEKARMEAQKKSDNLVDAEIRMVGDKYTISQVVMLMSYIRHAIRTGEKKDIKVSIGKKKSSPDSFNFVVNNSDVDDLIPMDVAEIN